MYDHHRAQTIMARLPLPARVREQVFYYDTDAIGSVRAVTDASGTVSYYDFTPFGEPWSVPSTPGTRQFAGKERDANTGLDYFGARYYAGGTARFTTVDPVMNVEPALFNPQRWNRYAYAGNNPLRFVDPDGADFWDFVNGVDAGGAKPQAHLSTRATRATVFVIPDMSGTTVRLTNNQLGSPTIRLLRSDNSLVTALTWSTTNFNLSTVTLEPGTYVVEVDPADTSTGSITVAVTSP